MPDGGNLERLRATVDAIETDQANQENQENQANRAGRKPEVAAVSLGDAALDAALPWGGLPVGALHQIVTETEINPGPALGFAVHLARQMCRQDETVRPIVWCTGRSGLAPALYVPALVQAGVPLDRLTLVRAGDDTDVLWAMEEALRAEAPALVVGAVKTVGLVAERRLHLAAGAGRTTGLLIHEQTAGSSAATAAVTRWRVGPAPSAPPAWSTGAAGSGIAGSAGGRRAVGLPRWHLTLERCRRGMPKAFEVEMDSEAHRLSVAA